MKMEYMCICIYKYASFTEYIHIYTYIYAYIYALLCVHIMDSRWELPPYTSKI